jgi:hypothetical protein
VGLIHITTHYLQTPEPIEYRIYKPNTRENIYGNLELVAKYNTGVIGYSSPHSAYGI